MEPQEAYIKVPITDDLTNTSGQAVDDMFLAENQAAQMRDFVETSMQYWKIALKEYQEILNEEDLDSAA